MTELRVRKVEIRGVPLIGYMRRLVDRGKLFPARIWEGKKVGVTYETDMGKTIGRIDDFRDIELTPSLHPGAFKQTFVDGPVLERAERILRETPALRGRMVPIEEKPMDWEGLDFSIRPSHAMFYAKIKKGEQWPRADLVPYEEIGIMPSAGVLNYGQGLFEGMKAYWSAAGNIVLFRPEDNAKRAQEGAKRLSLTPVPVEYFIDAVKRVVMANKHLIPPMGKGSLYIRPLLLGTGQILGVQSAPEHTFIVYVSPVGPYFKGGLTPIKLLVSRKYHRAVPGGTGNVKAIGNYAAGIKPSEEARSNGYAEVMYLDAIENIYIEEVGAANFFCVKDRIIYTPKLRGTILPGITRDSVITIARALGYKVFEKRISIDFAMQADEAFCTGTAAVVSPISSIVMEERIAIFNKGKVGPISTRLYQDLTAIQEQRADDPFGWVREIG